CIVGEGASSLAFLVRWVSQLCAFLWEGRQNSFNCPLVSNHVEVIFFYLIVIIIGYLPFDFLMVLNYYYHSVAFANIVFWAAKNCRFFLCSIWFSVSGIGSVFINGVCWVRGNFSGEPGHVYFVCVSLLCGVAGRFNFI
ncbi:MAG: hypothetical protein ACK559_05270, partial [bacterium]